MHPKIDWGSVSDAFAAGGTIFAVVVALWQSVIVRRQAKDEANEAADRFKQELVAAEDRHKTELSAQRELAKTQVDAQVELARIQRVHLREQEFKRSLIRVSRAGSTYTHELATLIEEGRRAAELPDRRAREDALRPLSKQLGMLAQTFVLEISGAHMLTQDYTLHEALNAVNLVALGGPSVEMAFRNPIINEGRMPEPTQLFQVMNAVHTALNHARQLAADRLHTGWD
ncbi:hypothetical protein BI330_07720 [Mycobacterium sp. CBMA 623]|nr:hypothetical protein [Mycobacteroides sp. CBMA 326]